MPSSQRTCQPEEVMGCFSNSVYWDAWLWALESIMRKVCVRSQEFCWQVLVDVQIRFVIMSFKRRLTLSRSTKRISTSAITVMCGGQGGTRKGSWTAFWRSKWLLLNGWNCSPLRSWLYLTTIIIHCMWGLPRHSCDAVLYIVLYCIIEKRELELVLVLLDE